MSKPKFDNITILIVDNDLALRVGIRALLEKATDISVVAEAENGENACMLLDKWRPKIILLDLKMPNFSPFEFEKWVRENYPETITLVLTAHDRDAYLSGMMNAGAAGYLNKDIQANQLINAIRRAALGESVYDDEQKRRAFEWQQDVEKKWNGLSKREQEVLCLLADGMCNKDISLKLAISTKTLDKHLEKIYEKLGVNSRIQAVIWKVKMGDFPY
jgi:DNA-binding NarL/FixJ family response regulator